VRRSMLMHSLLDKVATAETPVPKVSTGLPSEVSGPDILPSKPSYILKLAVIVALLIGGVVLATLQRRSRHLTPQVTNPNRRQV
jgi:hypothetical protein